MHMLRFSAFVITLLALASSALAAEKVYSGPQVGERATAFEVVGLKEAGAGGERKIDPAAAEKPMVLVFLHTIERSMVPLLRVIDEYAGRRGEELRGEVVFLSQDRIAGEQRMKAVNNSLKLKSGVGLSVDGAEGPGNYGLNKECMMTVVVTKGGKVTHNSALVQPGIADAGEIIAAMAAVSGDANPPTADALAGERGNMVPARARNRERMAEQEKFPGAAPTDAELERLLRQLVRPTNDEATVDRLMQEMREHIKEDAELKKQAADGWTRVLHFGDRYGTPYAREKGRELLKELKQE